MLLSFFIALSFDFLTNLNFYPENVTAAAVAVLLFFFLVLFSCLSGLVHVSESRPIYVCLSVSGAPGQLPHLSLIILSTAV